MPGVVDACMYATGSKQGGMFDVVKSAKQALLNMHACLVMPAAWWQCYWFHQRLTGPVPGPQCCASFA